MIVTIATKKLSALLSGRGWPKAVAEQALCRWGQVDAMSDVLMLTSDPSSEVSD